MTSAPVKHRGQAVVLGGVEYVMPPLSLRDAQVYWPRMAALQDGEGTSPLAALELAGAVAHACLVRNYPGLERATVDDAVDMDNWEQLLAAAAGGRSFRRWLETVREGEADAGNATPQPATPTPPAGTGAPSTPASPPPPAGGSTASTS